MRSGGRFSQLGKGRDTELAANREDESIELRDHSQGTEARQRISFKRPKAINGQLRQRRGRDEGGIHRSIRDRTNVDEPAIAVPDGEATAAPAADDDL